MISCMDDNDTKFEYVKDAFRIVDSIGAYDFTKVRNALYNWSYCTLNQRRLFGLDGIHESKGKYRGVFSK